MNLNHAYATWCVDNNEIYDGVIKSSATSVEGVSPQQAEFLKTYRNLPDPKDMGQQIVDRTVEAIKRNFEPPLEGGNYVIRLKGDLKVGKMPDPRDFESIDKAMGVDGRLSAATIGPRITGKFEVVRKSDGKVLKTESVNFGKVPVPVWDRSFVVDGKKRFMMHQWRRRPGVFTRQNEAGELVTEFNVDPATSSRVRSFKIHFDRSGANADFKLRYGSSKSIPMWDVAKLLGANEKDLQAAVGKKAAGEVLSNASDSRYEQSIRKLYGQVFKTNKRVKREKAELPLQELEDRLRSQFNTSRVDKGITRITLGTASDRVNKNTIMSSFSRLQEVANGEPSDDRESIALKKLYAPADLIAESVGRESTVDKYVRQVSGRLRALSDSGKDIRPKQLLKGGQFERNIKGRVTSSMVQRSDSGTNPLESFAQSTATTILGEGAIGSEMAIPKDAKLLNPGSVTFLDPVHTPESSRAGVVLHTPIRTKVVRDEKSKTDRDMGHSKLVSELLSPTGRTVEVSPEKTVGKVIGSFDQWERKDGKFVPKTNSQGLVEGWRDGEIVQVPPDKVDFYLKDSANLFDANSSLAPFGNSIAGGRVGYFNKHQVAAVPLVNAEVPLVQTKFSDTRHTNEELLAEEAGAVRSSFTGTVQGVREAASGARYIDVVPQGKRKAVTITLPKNIMLGGGTPLDSRIRVKEGDKVKPGDLLADSNFTKDGTMALGINLVTGYIPYHTSTFEDAVVISESAAKKLTSEHLYMEEARGETVRLGKKNWKKVAAMPLPGSMASKLDDDGVIKVGERIEPGDLYVVGYQSELLANAEKQKAAKRAGLYKRGDRRGLRKFNRFYERRWDHSHAGEVVKVEKVYDRDQKTVVGAKVFVKTQERAEVGDKIYGRHANKATIAEIVPDAEMPRNADGQHIELAYNPAAVTGRINPSQNFETFLGNIAKAAGKPEVIENFSYASNWQFVKDRLKKAGIADGQDLYDPRSGRTLKSIGVGRQYILKAKHQVDHKATARGIGNFQEDGRASKGKDGAQSLGELGVYGLLAQDAREFLRDAQLYKGEDRPAVWDALSKGERLPTAQVPTSFKRFQNYMKAAGIDMAHEASQSTFRLKPVTDRDVISMARSSGKDNVITDPVKTVKAGSAMPEKGGLFDMKATAGRGGEKWSRFELSTRLPNPVYEGAIRDVLGLSRKNFEKIVSGVQGVKGPEDQVIYGSAAIEHMLTKVDLGAVKQQAWDLAKTGKKDSERSAGYRTLRTLKMLEHNKLKPVDAFMRKQVLVLPANMRDFKVDQSTGDFIFGDVNFLYRNLGLIDDELKKARKEKMPPKVIAQLEAGLYDQMRELMQTEGSASLSGADYQGIVGKITGRRPDSKAGREVSDIKQSLLKSTLVQRRQILSGRTVIGPRDDLNIDEIGLPRQQAVAIFEPFLEAEWRKMNPSFNRTPAGRQRFKKFRADVAAYRNEGSKAATPEVDRVLDRTVKGRYLAIKRDPVLHGKGVQAFKPVLTGEKTLQLNPLVYEGFGADNDGDTMAIFAPITSRANAELRDKLTPQNGLFTIANGALAYGLSHEAILGLNRISRDPQGDKPKGAYKTLDEARKAFLSNKIEANDLISVRGQKTTYGRAAIDQVLPDGMNLRSLHNGGTLNEKYGVLGLSKGDISSVLTKIAVDNPSGFGKAANELRRLGQESATLTGTTLLMEDFKPILVGEREKAVAKLQKELKLANKIIDPRERQEAVRKAFDATLKPLNSKGMTIMRGKMVPKGDQRSNVNAEMTFSKARVKPVQLQQVMFGPGAVLDGNGDVVATPVLKSYSEGLSGTGYWATLHGARMGTVSKVIEVQDPGYLTKQVINTAMDQVVTESDCGTKNGIMMSLSDKGADLEGRFLAKPVRAGKKLFGTASMVTGNDLSLMRQKHQGSVKVRSPMTCEAKEGVCQKCVGGLPNGQTLRIGSNFGVKASQALGERSTQLTLSTFHSGGVYEPGSSGGARNLFEEASALLRMPGTMGGNKAAIAPIAGKVEKVQRNNTRGGFDLTISGGGSKETVFLPGNRRAPDGSDPKAFFKPGRNIKAGEQLTEGLSNPKELLEVTGDIDQVRGYLVNRLGRLFGDKGVLQRNVEGVVRAVTNTVEVVDPGDTNLLPGERLGLQKARQLQKKHQLSTRPVLKGIDVAPRETQEDFLAKMNFNNLRRVLTEGAQVGAETNYHGTHPIPALAYGLEFNRKNQFGAQPPSKGKY